jgi:solute:Na+ symporter, SSS family
MRGALCVILLLGIFGGDSTHLHSWGSIFIQDAILPFRKTAFTAEQHIRLLRFSIIGVAVFAFVFGSLFQQTEYVQMWWSVTQSIFCGGAGAAIIGGLYWKKGTAAGAWAAMVTGSTLSIGGIACRELLGAAFPLNGVQISFGAAGIAIAVYIVVSLLTCRADFNMDRMLHRGAYARADLPTFTATRGKIGLGRLIGFDANFSTGDKWIAGALFGYSMLLLAIFLVGTVWNLVAPWPLSAWSAFWHVIGVGLPVFFAVVTGVWFTWGGVRDTLALFRLLKRERVDVSDDGMVVNHRNLDEEEAAEAPRS